MGVKILDLIFREKIDFSDLSRKIIAIDAPNIIIGLFSFVRKNKNNFSSNLMLDRTQRPISHLYGLLYRINFYYSKKIFPIFCFDGKVSDLKRLTTKDQLNDFIFTKNRYNDAIKNDNRQLAKEISMSHEFFWPNILLESQKLLGMLGVPFIMSPASAEAQCAYLVKEEIVNLSNSQDYDSLLFGCPKMIQNLSKTLRRKIKGNWKYIKLNLLLINLSKTLNRLKIDQFQLIDIGILIGNDYFPGIKGIGAKLAFNLIKKYGRIENVIENEKNNYDFNKLTFNLLQKIRDS